VSAPRQVSESSPLPPSERIPGCYEKSWGVWNRAKVVGAPSLAGDIPWILPVTKVS